MTYQYLNKGHYTCNGKLFFNKIEAIIEANSNPNAWLEWDFHNKIFGSYDWSKDPKLSLDELYKQRAQQLRDNYDYCVLFYSGGSDSHNILRAFIDNGIKLDEIYLHGAYEAEERAYNKLGYDKKSGYYTREVKQALPFIKKVAAEHHINVRVYDWTRDIINEVNNNIDWFWHCGVRFDPTCAVRYRLHKIFRDHSEMRHKGKRVAFIYGVDKPRLIRDDKSIYFSFLDVIMTLGTQMSAEIKGEYWENDELFYWSPNMPEICIAQSHAIVNYFKYKNIVHLIKHKKNIASFHDMEYYREANRIIYPTKWDHNTWQIDKPQSGVYNEMAQWFYDFDEAAQARKKWESSLGELGRVVGSNWFNKDDVFSGIKGHLSPMYKIQDYSINS